MSREEIEETEGVSVSPEMIAAGMQVLYRFDRERDDARETLLILLAELFGDLRLKEV